MQISGRGRWIELLQRLKVVVAKPRLHVSTADSTTETASSALPTHGLKAGSSETCLEGLCQTGHASEDGRVI